MTSVIQANRTKILAVMMIIGISFLTYPVLATYRDPVTAFLVTLTIHIAAWITADHCMRVKSKERWMWGLLAAMLTINIYSLAVWQGLRWFDDSVIVACLLALIEPATIWTIARITAQANDR